MTRIKLIPSLMSYFTMSGNNSAPAEIIVYDSALSIANRQAIEAYLNTKWSVY